MPGEIRQPAYLAACLSDEGSVCSDFGKNRSCGSLKDGSSFCLTSDGWMNNGDSERCGFRYLFWGCNSDGENGDGGICFKPDCGMRRIRRVAETAARGETDPTALRETMKEIHREAMTAK